MVDVFLLLGSNLGNREWYLKEAVKQIEKLIAPVSKASAVYETQSWGKAALPDYLNQVVLLKTELPAGVILEKVLAIEISLGRKRAEKWGSRTIDIDILFYGDEIIEQPGLTVPHPELHNRSFTLTPLAEIAPAFVHPRLMKNILALKKAVKDSLIVKKF